MQFLYGQNCNIRLHGRVVDEVTNIPLPYATLYLETQKRGSIADEQGYFELNKVCAGPEHLTVSHISCEPYRIYIEVRKDSLLVFRLHHHEELMNELLVHGKHGEQSLENSGTIDASTIRNKSNENLADIIKEITGVSALRTGSGISKPIIHGLSGNRIAILNAGVLQAGQQWGNDHAPEIDVFSAERISVIKGVSALVYTGNSLGGVVLIEPEAIGDDPHLHGRLNTIYQSNGRGTTLNLSLLRGGQSMGWKITGTIKKFGDRRTPHYFLNNTGVEEANASVSLEIGKHKKWRKQLFFSTFNAEIGILRGSHIGNLTDLKASFTQAIPFFTETKFSYGLEAPKQRVGHQLLRLSVYRKQSDKAIFDLSYALQYDHRREYDIRRSGRSDIPALNLNQFNQQIDAKYEKSFAAGNFIKIGLLGEYANNTNNPDTGILPLIPDYNKAEGATFGLWQFEKRKILTEVGVRIQLNHYSVAAISRELPRKIIRYNSGFFSSNFSAGLNWKASETIKAKVNLGYSERPPAINELYSFGLHQGVSSLEVGNTELKKERAVKGTISMDYNSQEKLFFQALVYAQYVQNFIYLKPAPEPVLTIRGAFPLFNYDKTNAYITGFDGLMSYEPFAWFRYVAKISILRGSDLANKLPLIYMPANNFSNEFRFSLNNAGKLQNNQFSLAAETVCRQTNYKNGQDFFPPPKGFTLLKTDLHTELKLPKSVLHINFTVKNLLNTVYRDYLNRQRYFADEPGRDFLIKLNWEF